MHGELILPQILTYGLFNHVSSTSPMFLLFKITPLLTSIGNMVLLIVILYIYMGSYREVQYRFTRSLVIFSLLFLVQNLFFAVYFIFNIPNNLPMIIAPILFLWSEFIGFVIFLKVTWNERVLIRY
jgi:hypothetical protein